MVAVLRWSALERVRAMQELHCGSSNACVQCKGYTVDHCRVGIIFRKQPSRLLSDGLSIVAPPTRLLAHESTYDDAQASTPQNVYHRDGITGMYLTKIPKCCSLALKYRWASAPSLVSAPSSLPAMAPSNHHNASQSSHSPHSSSSPAMYYNNGPFATYKLSSALLSILHHHPHCHHDQFMLTRL